ncbi:unnamed protein product, partial [Effrenium voratum]
LSQRILKQKMPTAQAALELCYALHSFSRVAKLLPSVEAVPALYEKAIAQSAWAAMTQSCWRAHVERRVLGSLKRARLLRRAAICIQRCWRWNLLKRRIELLAGAVQVAHSIQCSTLYIEERLLHSLNTIAAIDRYPRLPESQIWPWDMPRPRFCCLQAPAAANVGARLCIACARMEGKACPGGSLKRCSSSKCSQKRSLSGRCVGCRGCSWRAWVQRPSAPLRTSPSRWHRPFFKTWHEQVRAV